MEAFGTHGRPGLDTRERRIGSRCLEPLADADGLAWRAVGPGSADSLAEDALLGVGRCQLIEENPLDRGDRARLAHRNEECRLEARKLPLSSWTPGVKAQVFEGCPDLAPLAHIALRQSPFDRSTSLPDCKVNSRVALEAGGHARGIDRRQVCDASKSSDYVPTVATCVARYENGSITLADGQRWGFVGMARAPTHCGITGPIAPDAPNKAA